jgi:hypothetical protein
LSGEWVGKCWSATVRACGDDVVVVEDGVPDPPEKNPK